METNVNSASPLDGCVRGWVAEHHMYGKWFISREAVVSDWKNDHKQAYPDEPVPEPCDEAVETWFNEQISWIEVRAYGKQLSRPDMGAIETHWRDVVMAKDTNTLHVEREVIEVCEAPNALDNPPSVSEGRAD